ncbi:MAG: T9SS type A sorting domain-containing protein [candidate division WOR-3 bacterium]|nr:MAG: T9SS type A sorting domain-containing protein [candidate division WOR-3 bacterium]
MILLVLTMLSTLSENQIDIKLNTPSRITFQVEFSDINKAEQVPITRFVITEAPPQCEYTIVDVDSSVRQDIITDGVSQPVSIGKPLNIHNYTVYPVIIHPSFLNEYIKIYLKSIEITINFMPAPRGVQFPLSFHKVFKDLILNYTGNGDARPGGYLIITTNSFYDEVLPLARWKEKKGWYVTVATLSQTGSDPGDIKNYIANQYHTASPPPEYVLLIGDVDSLPPYSTATPPSRTDYPYTLIDGDDFMAELLIGRLPANTPGELETMIGKILGYEQTPYVVDQTWFTRSLMVGANYPEAIMTTPLPTKRWVREKFLEYGFPTVDTVFYPPTTGGTEITNSVNQGVTFVNYRSGSAEVNGWSHPLFFNDDVTGLSNGWKLPIVTSITCLNGNFGAPTCFGEAWLRAGNAINPRGAVAFFGASAATTSSRWNNCLDYGIYWAFLKEHIYELGPALYRGKMEVYMNFPGDTTWADGSSFYFHTYNLLGDPSLEVWTGIPDSFIVSHLSSIPAGTNSFSIQVQNAASQPVEEAMVSLYKDGEVKEVQYTDASGSVDFNFSTTSEDTLFVTITKHNFKPYSGYCIVQNSAVYVGYDSHIIDDQAGNNNGEINPGETIELTVTLKNYGNATTATNVSARLTTTDPLIAVIDSIQSYGTMIPGGTATASPFVFGVSTNAKHDHIIKFNLAISSSQGNWNSTIWIDVKAPEFAMQRHQMIDNGNGTLEPGETSEMIISLKNVGGLDGSNIAGILRSLNPGVSVIDSVGTFGDIPVGDSSTNSTDHFIVNASLSVTPGHKIAFDLLLSGNNFRDTIGFRVVIGGVSQDQPLGPDDYGYFAYDDTDVDYEEHPTYGWVEIDPVLGGPGDSISLVNDETAVLYLPFNFKFYGDWYSKVSISSNGYIALDSTWIADMYNWPIPSTGGPPLLIAPFWDDLDPTATDSSGHVCYWYDDANHRFIVEYSRVQHLHNMTNPPQQIPAELQTFEVILLDPQYHPTETGDGEILFQYNDITNDDQWHNYATVGIENREHTTGLEYSYSNTYPMAAAPLANNRAIKFTPDPPDTFPFPGADENTTVPFAGEQLVVYPNPFRKMTNISFGTGHSVKDIELKIFDVSGRLIKNFLLPTSYSLRPAFISWDGTDDAGHKVSEGIYFVRLEETDITAMRKIIFIR